MSRDLLPLKKKRSKKKADIIRKGDVVLILEPYEFIRCGYPLSLREASDKVKHIKEYVKLKKDLCDLVFSKKYPDAHTVHHSIYKDCRDSRLEHQIEYSIDNILAKIYLYDQNYGGKYRTLHTKYQEQYLNIRAKVIGIKYHKTGKYSPGYSSVSYEGDYDYEPAYLEGEQTHKILHVQLIEDGDWKADYDLNIIPIRQVWCGRTLWIEDTNVRKLTKEESHKDLTFRTKDAYIKYIVRTLNKKE